MVNYKMVSGGGHLREVVTRSELNVYNNSLGFLRVFNGVIDEMIPPMWQWVSAHHACRS